MREDRLEARVVPDRSRRTQPAATLPDGEVAREGFAPVPFRCARARGEGLGKVARVQVHRQLEWRAGGTALEVQEVVRVERGAEGLVTSVGELGLDHYGPRIW